jgi:hypothetical protein
MHTRFLSLAAALALSVSSGAMAQMTAHPTAPRAAAPSAATSAVGRWLYDTKGNKIGSVRFLADDGQTAVIMIGSYFQPGSHEARVPAYALSLVDGKVTLHPETVEALNDRSQW